MLVQHMLLLPGLTQYFGGFRSFYFVFLLLLESAINIFKIVSLWRLYLSAKNEITELKILHVEIKTFWSITPCLLKSTLLNAILNTKLNKFIWKWVFVLKNIPKRLFHLFLFKKISSQKLSNTCYVTFTIAAYWNLSDI